MWRWEQRLGRCSCKPGNTKGPQGASRSEARSTNRFLASTQKEHPTQSWTSGLQNCETHTSVVHPVCGTLLRKLEQTMTEVDDKYTDLSPLTWLTNRFRSGCPLISFHTGDRSLSAPTLRGGPSTHFFPSFLVRNSQFSLVSSSQSVSHCLN